jgi:hypothetical protein
MSEVDRELCRRSAAECVDLARITTDPKTKEILLRHAQEWTKLAYSGSDARLQELLADFNSKQLGAAFPFACPDAVTATAAAGSEAG